MQEIKYSGNTGRDFTIKDNLLITLYSTVPLKNISKIFVIDISKKAKLGTWFWMCLGGGILSLFAGAAFRSAELFYTIGVALLIPAVILFIVFLTEINAKQYALVVESNSGSSEMFIDSNLSKLLSAQLFLEQAIISTDMICTYNIDFGPKNELIIHGNVMAPVAQGYNPTSSM